MLENIIFITYLCLSTEAESSETHVEALQSSFKAHNSNPNHNFDHTSSLSTSNPPKLSAHKKLESEIPSTILTYPPKKAQEKVLDYPQPPNKKIAINKS